MNNHFPNPTPAGPPDVPSRTDADLVAAYRAHGSEEAFAHLVERHGAMVFRTCLRILGNVHEAEDAAQAAFLVLARRLPSGRPDLSVWLHWVARHVAYKAIRSRARRGTHESQTAREGFTMFSTEAELREELDVALGRLPGPQRQAVILRYLEGRSQEEAARLCRCPQSTLADRATKGLERLRAILQRRGVTVSASVLASVLAEEASAGLAVTTLLPFKLAAVGRDAASGSATALAEAVLNALFWGKVRIMVGVTLLIVLSGAALSLAAHWRTSKDPAPAASPPILGGEKPLPDMQGTIFCRMRGAPSWTAYVPPMDKNRVHILSWDRSDWGKPFRIARLNGGRAPVVALASSPDGKTLASAGQDGEVRLWDTAKPGVPTRIMVVPGAQVTVLAFSGDGRALLVGCGDGSVWLWNVKHRAPRRLDVPVDGSITQLAASADSRFVAVASQGGEVALFETGPRGLKKIWAARAQLESGKLDVVIGLEFSPDGKYLATLSYHWNLGVVDAEAARQVQRYHRHNVVNFWFTPDSRTLLAAIRQPGEPWLVPMIELDLKVGVERIVPHDNRPPQFFVSEGGRFFTLIENGKARRFDLAKLKEVFEGEVPFSGGGARPSTRAQ